MDCQIVSKFTEGFVKNYGKDSDITYFLFHITYF